MDILTQISGLTFDEAWASRARAEIDGQEVAFLGREALIVNRRASGRLKDLADVERLEGHSKS